jgi:hypothetical protein
MGREIQQFLVEILGSECTFLIVLGGTEESIIRYDAKPQNLQYTYENVHNQWINTVMCLDGTVMEYWLRYEHFQLLPFEMMRVLANRQYYYLTIA